MIAKQHTENLSLCLFILVHWLPCKGCKELRLNEPDNRFVFGISKESLIPFNCLLDERGKEESLSIEGERAVDKRG